MGFRKAAEGRRVLISAPFGRDAETLTSLLTSESYEVSVCAGLADIAASVGDQTGVVLLTEEALAGDLPALREKLSNQHSWSDVPFVLLAAQRAGRTMLAERLRLDLFDLATNSVVLERPLGKASLLSAVASAMRLRQKQFEMRDRMLELSQSEAALREESRQLEQLARTLEDKVAERTDDLEREMAIRLAAEEALRQSQKMEAVGQLTGGIAHDFNNMLTGVIGGINLAKRRIAAGRLDDIDRFMDAATESAHRAAALTQRLLAFSRRQSLDAKPFDVNHLLISLEDLLRRTIQENIALNIVQGEDVKNVVADANQLENAILNLAINARDAMPDGGRLTVETSLVQIDNAYASAKPGIEPGHYVVIAVSDTGVGMPPDVIEKVFDPFFTTKPIGQGTGLGLSMVYGFAKQSGGQVRIHSRPGAGTSVKIYLPASEGAAHDVADAAVPDEAKSGNGLTVLVIEDDASVRLLVREILAELSYHVIEAGDADAAVPILRSERKIDLMISDVGLPGMNGRQLAEVARVDRPDLPILFVTGYAENAATRAGFLGTNMAMITKPFTVEALTAKVETMIA